MRRNVFRSEKLTLQKEVVTKEDLSEDQKAINRYLGFQLDNEDKKKQ